MSQSDKKNDKTQPALVLDLDHTLVHFRPISSTGIKIDDRLDTAGQDWHAFTPSTRRSLGQGGTGDIVAGHFCMRPGARRLIEQAAHWYDIYVYSLGGDAYVQAVVRILDPDRCLIRQVMSRSNAVCLSLKKWHAQEQERNSSSNNNKKLRPEIAAKLANNKNEFEIDAWTQKDLAHIGLAQDERDTKRTLILDDRPNVWKRHFANVLWISPFYASDHDAKAKDGHEGEDGQDVDRVLPAIVRVIETAHDLWHAGLAFGHDMDMRDIARFLTRRVLYGLDVMVVAAKWDSNNQVILQRLAQRLGARSRATTTTVKAVDSSSSSSSSSGMTNQDLIVIACPSAQQEQEEANLLSRSISQAIRVVDYRWLLRCARLFERVDLTPFALHISSRPE